MLSGLPGGGPLSNDRERSGQVRSSSFPVTEATFNEDFRDLLIALSDAGARFVLIGGWALALHGHGRGTDDMDVLVEASNDNAVRVYRALVAFGAPVQAHGVNASLFAQAGYGYRVGVRPNLIELLTAVDGISFEEALAEGLSFEIEGRKIPYIGKVALLKNKLAAGRPKDLADAEWLKTHADE